MKKWMAILAVVAVVCLAVAISYSIRYRLAEQENNTELDALSQIRQRAMTETAPGEDGEPSSPGAAPVDAPDGRTPEPEEPARPENSASQLGESVREETAEAGQMPPEQALSEQASPGQGTGDNKAAIQASEAEPETADAAGEGQAETGAPQARTEVRASSTVQGIEAAQQPAMEQGKASQTVEGSVAGTQQPDATPGPTPGIEELILEIDPKKLPREAARAVFGGGASGPTAEPSPTPDRSVRTSALAYEYLEKRELDPDRILPELKEIYELNHDLVGWLHIDGTVIDYPVVQSEDQEFYLKHDFYGKSNANGQIILDKRCDPYTPSYNLVISGHHMNNGSMFGGLPRYQTLKYWQEHRFVEFDTLMARGRYVVFAAFYSADYDEHEEGFRYNADIQYKLETDRWLQEIRDNQIYDTGIDARFGDRFITLTTCHRARRRNGRFVVVARQIREGETFE